MRDRVKVALQVGEFAAQAGDTVGKLAADFVAFDLYKEADALEFMARPGMAQRAMGLARRAAPAIQHAMPAIGKGMAMGAGAAVPAYAAGRALMGNAEERSHRVMRDARNQALLTGLGIAGIAGGASHGMLGGASPLNMRMAAHVLLDEALCKEAAEDPQVRQLLLENRAEACDLLRLVGRGR